MGHERRKLGCESTRLTSRNVLSHYEAELYAHHLRTGVNMLDNVNGTDRIFEVVNINESHCGGS
eukprot:scaffold40686_cov51-Attheya_sp.AAC.1